MEAEGLTAVPNWAQSVGFVTLEGRWLEQRQRLRGSELFN